jgi:hypothetical protein
MWWLLTPDGHPMRSFGANSVNPNGSVDQETGRAPYGEAVDALFVDDEAWADSASQRLRYWGMNTAGAWSRPDLFAPRIATTPTLRISGGDWQSGEVADWFDPAWLAAVDERVQAEVVPFVGQPGVLGWYLDNEIRWGPDWRGTETLLQLYLSLPAEAPGKAVAVDSLVAGLGDLQAVASALGVSADRDTLLTETAWPQLDRSEEDPQPALTSAFLRAAAERYFSVTVSAVRDVDPDHLILGNREVSWMTPAEVWEVAAGWLDVLSANNYVFVDGVAEAAVRLSGALHPGDYLEDVFAHVGRPMLITEFGFRALDAGLPSSWPPTYPRLPTQADRAAAFTDYAEHADEQPFLLGWHWFAWSDQPPGGRFDGENNNWGLVDLQDGSWAELTAAVAAVTTESWDDLLVPAR